MLRKFYLHKVSNIDVQKQEMNSSDILVKNLGYMLDIDDVPKMDHQKWSDQFWFN